MNHIAKTNVELPSYVFAQIQVPTGLPLYAGEIYMAETLTNTIGNYNIYDPMTLTDVTKQVPCLLLNGNFDELPDGRRANGNPNYGTYKYRVGEIANTLRLNVPEMSVEISTEALNPEVTLPQVS